MNIQIPDEIFVRYFRRIICQSRSYLFPKSPKNLPTGQIPPKWIPEDRLSVGKVYMMGTKLDLHLFRRNHAIEPLRLFVHADRHSIQIIIFCFGDSDMQKGPRG